MSEPTDAGAPVPGPGDQFGYQPPPAFAPRYGPAAAPSWAPYPPPAAPSWAPYPPPAAPAPPPAPPRRRNPRTGILVYTGIAVVAVVAVIVAIVIATSGGDDAATHRFTLPHAFDGYTKIDNDSTRQVTSSMRALGAGNATTSAMFNAAAIGVYSRDTGDLPGLIAVALPSSKIPGSAGQSPDQIATELIEGALPPDRTLNAPAGRHGGAVKCGRTTVQTVTVAVCAWSDARATGLLLAVRPSVAPVRLAQIENDFRDRVE